MKKQSKFIVGIIAALFTLSLLASGCGGDKPAAKPEVKPAIQYPTKPIQVIVPAGAGGDTDTNIRIMGKYLEQEWVNQS